jgi:hypothetical protein
MIAIQLAPITQIKFIDKHPDVSYLSNQSFLSSESSFIKIVQTGW